MRFITKNQKIVNLYSTHLNEFKLYIIRTINFKNTFPKRYINGYEEIVKIYNLFYYQKAYVTHMSVTLNYIIFNSCES